MSLALFGAFCVQADITGGDILHPWVFTGLLFGVMMSYAEWFTDQALDDGHQQETLDASFASTNAAVEKFAAKAENAVADISSLTSWIASADWELTAVSVVREKGGEGLQQI